ncbi:MAG: hypothetical protein FWF38_00480 [Spirochaetaceae bacterium]|nr:hypothetical protein [Spirochaetaceae bacterium]
MDVEKEKKLREAFKSVFLKNQEGTYVLCAILNETGNFKTDEKAINPELVSFGNWLLNKCGINTTYNFSAMINAIAKSSSDEDLILYEKQIKQEER